MALECLTEGCKGKITTGRPGRQRYWHGDRYDCPKCKAPFVIDVPEDYEDDQVAFLKRINPTEAA